MSEQELLTVSELSQKLKVQVSWLYSRIRGRGGGTIPLVREGKYIRFNYEEVWQWLEHKQNNL